MEIPKYLVIKLEQTDKGTVTATDITGRCEVIEHDADRKTENSSEKPNNCEDLQDWKDRMWAEAIVTEPQTDTEIAKAIVHKMIDDAVIAEDAYPDLRQKMHDAVDEYEPQTDCAWK